MKNTSTISAASARSATHYGTCQICESVQKADVKTNRLAAHGYTLAYGWQTGTCDGSGELPLEVSKDYALAYLQACKVAVANFVATNCPQRTVTGRWEKDLAINAWHAEQQSQSGRKQYIAWTEQRLAKWAPSEQLAVEAVEAVERATKTVRHGIRALSGAEKLAKRDLVKFGEKFQGVLETAINGELYAERTAFYANNNNAGNWPRWSEITDIPYFQTNRVAAYVKLAAKSGYSDVIVGAAKLQELSGIYEAAKAAHKAAKA